jgi:hypothetical protein
MITLTLKPTDCIHNVLPIVEAAMESGDICRLGNLHYLGPFEIAALMTLSTATHLRDPDTGRVHHAHPDFQLVGIDHCGITHHLIN